MTGANHGYDYEGPVALQELTVTLTARHKWCVTPLIFKNTSSMYHRQFEWDRILLAQFMRISAANIGPKQLHLNRTASWLISIPRSCERSPTFLSDSGNRRNIIAARRMASRLELK